MNWASIISAVLVAIIGSGGTTAFVQHLINKSKSDPMRDGVRLLLQDKIEALGTKYCADGQITYAQRKYLRAAYTSYKGMGGNGDIEDLMHDIERLEVVYK